MEVYKKNIEALPKKIQNKTGNYRIIFCLALPKYSHPEYSKYNQ
jgi:hypothetical protein